MIARVINVIALSWFVLVTFVTVQHVIAINTGKRSVILDLLSVHAHRALLVAIHIVSILALILPSGIILILFGCGDKYVDCMYKTMSKETEKIKASKTEGTQND